MLGTGGTSATAPPIKHYGSIYGETDYKTTTHILTAGMNAHVNQHVDLFGQVNYSKSESAFDPINMISNSNEAEALEHIESADYDYSTINMYSDLDYNFMNFRVGAIYKLTETVAFTADFDYYDLTDNLGYVYGNESGSFYVIRTGFKLGGLGW
jgi:hypothetical protein